MAQAMRHDLSHHHASLPTPMEQAPCASSKKAYARRTQSSCKDLLTHSLLLILRYIQEQWALSPV